MIRFTPCDQVQIQCRTFPSADKLCGNADLFFHQVFPPAHTANNQKLVQIIKDDRNEGRVMSLNKFHFRVELLGKKSIFQTGLLWEETFPWFYLTLDKKILLACQYVLLRIFPMT